MKYLILSFMNNLYSYSYYLRNMNLLGNLYVDESCIDCDVCRWISPATFGRKGIKSAVIRQPVTENDKLQVSVSYLE